MAVRGTARGIGIRALVLIVAAIVVGFWLLSLALDLAGAVVQLALWAGLLVIAAIVIAFVVRRFRRR